MALEERRRELEAELAQVNRSLANLQAAHDKNALEVAALTDSFSSSSQASARARTPCVPRC